MKRLIKANEVDDYIQELCKNTNCSDDKIQLLEEIGEKYDLDIIKYLSKFNTSKINDYYEKLEEGFSLDEIKRLDKLFNQIIKNDNFDYAQLTVIEKAFSKNLSEDEIKIVMNSGEALRMNQILYLFYEEYVNKEIVEKIANSNLSWEVIRDMRHSNLDFNNLSDEEIQYIMDSLDSKEKLNFVIYAFSKHLSIKNIEDYLKYFGIEKFYEDINSIIIDGLKNNISIEDIKKFISYNNYNIAKQLIKYAKAKEFDKIEILTDNRLDAEKQNIIMDIFKAIDNHNYNISTENIKSLLDDNFDKDQIKEIYYGITNKLTWDQIKIFAKNNLKSQQMRAIRITLIDNKGKNKEHLIKLMANPDFGYYQLWSLSNAINCINNDDIIKYLANPAIDDDIMDNIIAEVRNENKSLNDIKEEYDY